jgi:acetyltransferase-like isoleucine patch superfamily enzyme
VAFETFILKLKRGEGPLFKTLKQLYKSLVVARLPTPRFLRPVGNFCYHLNFLVRFFVSRTVTFFYREPVFRYRCEHVGQRLSLSLLPEAPSHTMIYIGDDVSFHGKCGIYSARVFDNPVLRIGNHVSIGHQVNISCNREIVIEDDVYIANLCTISDNDGHPIDAKLRASGAPPPIERTRPVRIGRYAWIGAGCFILKGVDIGTGSIIGAGSVVTTNVPPYTIVAGNPAKVVRTLSPEQTEEKKAAI